MPEHISDFVDRYWRPNRQLKLKLTWQAYDTASKIQQATSTLKARRIE